MNCSLAQRRLLGVENPERIPSGLRAHFAICSSCRDWRDELLQVERAIPLLPVPRSRAKSRLLQRLLYAEANLHAPAKEAGRFAPCASKQTVPIFSAGQTVAQLGGVAGRHIPVSGVLHSRILRFAAAAALCLLLGWLIVSTGPHTAPEPVLQDASPADPLLTALSERDSRLVRAATPRQRVEILADLADDLRGKTRDLVLFGPGEELLALANLYEQVVRGGILKQAQAIPRAERQSSLEPIAARLSAAARAVETLIQETPPEYNKPLYAIAAVARAANRELRALLQEKA